MNFVSCLFSTVCSTTSAYDNEETMSIEKTKHCFLMNCPNLILVPHLIPHPCPASSGRMGCFILYNNSIAYMSFCHLHFTQLLIQNYYIPESYHPFSTL